MMGVGETTFALIRCHQLAKLDSVNGATCLWQVARLIVAPQLTVWQRSDGLSELCPASAPRACADSCPMQS